jgi:hypothetical protein
MAKQKKGKTEAKDITNRFLQMMEEVITDGLCINRGDFANIIGEYPQNLGKMEKHERSPTLVQIANACQHFGYSPTWIILGIGDKIMNIKDQKTVEQRLNDLEAEMNKVKRLVKLK